MTETYLRFAILGLATGSLYALVALGVVIVRRTSGVLNFAAGAVGAFAAFVTYELRDTYDVPAAVAVPVGIVTGALLGVLTQIIVMRLLRGASSLTRLIATLGVMTLIQGLIVVFFGTEDRSQPESLVSTKVVEIGGDLTIPRDRLFLIVLSLVLAVSLTMFYARTKFGLATSAVAENRTVAASYGISPSRVEVINFALGGALAALAAILIAPVVGLTQSALVLVIVPALAAALFGRFTSFSLTVVGALLIGAVQAIVPVIPAVAERVDYLSGLPQAIPLLIIVVVTVLRGRSRPSRGELSERLPLPGTGTIRPALIGIGALIGVLCIVVGSDSLLSALARTCAMGVLLLSVLVVTGYAGQLSLAQFALAGFGAWVASRLYSELDMPFLLALAAGIACSIPLGLIVALPALRTRGVDLAVATLGLALMIQAMIFNSSKLTGGYSGTAVPNPTIFGWSIDGSAHPGRYALVCLVCLIVAGLLVANIRRGRAGRRLLAVRGNERAASALGIGVYSAKLYAFGVAAALAALSGVLIGFQSRNVLFQQFDVFGSISAVEYATVGGIGWIGGVVVGAALSPGSMVQLSITSLFGPAAFTNYAYLIAGVAVLVMLIAAPNGIAALTRRTWARARLPFTPALFDKASTASRPTKAREGGRVEVDGLTVKFGGVTALNDVSLTASPGQVLGIIGPNGAGKTTLLDAITGFTSGLVGTIRLDGSHIERWTPERRARAGLGRSFQAVELFNELTVRENLLIAADDRSGWTYLTDMVHPGRPRSYEVLDNVVAELGLESVLDVRPSELSHGQTRMVGIARAVCNEPKVLFLDEPAAGLDKAERKELSTVIRYLTEVRGLAIVLVEHDVDLVASVCDRLMVLDFGVCIAEGSPDEVLENAAVISAYVGGVDTPATALASVAAGRSEGQHDSKGTQ